MYKTSLIRCAVAAEGARQRQPVQGIDHGQQVLILLDLTEECLESCRLRHKPDPGPSNNAEIGLAKQAL